MEEKNIKFEELNLSTNIKKALVDAGYENTTPIQEKAIPMILEGRDLIGQSQTGTGKTASYSLPIIEKIDKKNKNVQAMILCPTRELALQITGEIRKFTKYEEGVSCLAIYGGEQIEKQIRALKKGIKIIVGTPGRVMDHMRRKTLKLNDVKMVVLDEADEMLNMGFEEDINKILSDVPSQRQTVLFSATMNERILNIAKKYLTNPVNIKIKAKELTVDKIEQISLELKQGMKDEIVMRLIDLNNPKKAVIFCNTKKKADNLIEVLKHNGYKAECLHGDIKQTQRQRIINRLKKGEFKILVATDVVARGIDVDELELVINYDIPQEEEYYVHRIGRTGRNGNSGKAYTFVVGRERNKIKGIEKYANTKILQGKLPTKEQISKIKDNKIIEEIQEIIDNKKCMENKKNEKILLKLLEKNDEKAIAMALLEMLNKNCENTETFNEQYSKEEMVKLFITVGKMDSIKNKDIIGSISSNTIVSGSEIGKIKILDKYSFVEIPGEYVNEVLKDMQGKEIKGRKCNIEVAKT
jgi:ATP-dependent RNA helicase DeaD